MNKIKILILSVLALALVFSLTACLFIRNDPGTATKEPANAPTEAPVTPTEEPVDPIVGIWSMQTIDYETGEEIDSGVNYIFEKDGAGAIKGGGILYPFSWLKTEDKLIVTADEKDEVLRIVELTDSKLQLKPSGETDPIKYVRKQPRTTKTVDKNKLIGRWDFDLNDPNSNYLHIYENGYGEDYNSGTIDFFSWTLIEDELRLHYIENDNSYYVYVTVDGDNLSIDNDLGEEPFVLSRNTKDARTVNTKVTKDDLVGNWYDGEYPIIFESDGTGSAYGSSYHWNLYGDLLQLIYNKDSEPEYEYYFTTINGKTLILANWTGDYEFTRK